MRIKARASVLICAACLFGSAAWPQARPTVPITLTVDTAVHGYAIPIDFSGLGFETASELLNHYGVRGYFFSPSNAQAITLLQNIGVKNIRVGGGTGDGYGKGGYCGTPIPTERDIDQLFEFAHDAGIKVIYSLRFLNPIACANPNLAADDARTALYIWTKYRANLDSFAIGNEPDWHSYHSYPGHAMDAAIYETVAGQPGSAYPSYLAAWRKFDATILQSLPVARFVGPDTGAYSTQTYIPNSKNGISWTQKFAEDERDAKNRVGEPLLVDVTQHHYVGGSPKGTSTQEAIDNMLSKNWVDQTEISKGPDGPETYTPYPWLYRQILDPVRKLGISYRMTEANDVLGGVQGASNGYAAALWALDYMHWWAAHGMAGVNFHNNPWIRTDTIVPSPNPCPSAGCGNYYITPKGYGIKAFDLGGHGYVEPITITNPSDSNVTAYAVGNAGNLTVTIINKTHRSSHDSVDAVVTILPKGFAAASAAVMMLTDGDPGNAARMSATLGGASISNHAPWQGRWAGLSAQSHGEVQVTVPATTAAVVKIRAAGEDTGPVEMDQNGSLETFAVGPGGRIWHNRQKGATASSSSPAEWSGWTALPGEARSSGGVAVANNLDNTLQVFVPSLAGDVNTNRQTTPGGGWSGWTDLGGGSNGITHLEAANNADGSLVLFGIGANGDVWYASQNAPGVAWSGWTDLSGKKIEPGFVVGNNLDGGVEVFGVDARGSVWHNGESADRGWSGWTQLSGQSVAPLLAIARDMAGDIFVFGVSKANEDVWDISQKTPGGIWGPWHDLGTAGLQGTEIQPGFVVGQNADGRLEIAGVGSDGHVWHLSQREPGRWSQWDSLAGTDIDPQLSIANTADGRLQIFAVSHHSPNLIWTNWQITAGGRWSGWTDFGKRRIKFYSSQP